MSKLISLGCAIVMLCASSVASAGSESGFYLGASVGNADSSAEYKNTAAGDVSFDDADTGYKVFLGYNFGVVPFLNLAVEGSYVDFGTAKGTVAGSNAESKVNGVDAFGLVGFNLGPVALFAKAGAINWDSETTVLSSTVNRSGTDPAYGVGLQFQLGSVGLRAEYEVFDLDEVEIGFASIGMSYTF